MKKKAIIYYLAYSLFFILNCHFLWAKDYYFHPKKGNDAATGLSEKNAFKSLSKIAGLSLQPGDRLLLAAGETFAEPLVLKGLVGEENAPIIVQSHAFGGATHLPDALIDAAGFGEGILLENVSFLHLKGLQVTANGSAGRPKEGDMRVGLLLTVAKGGHSHHVTIENIHIYDVFYEDPGFVRGAEEVRTENGTQKYGWGIRLINQQDEGLIEEVSIRSCRVENVSHTGIKFTGKLHQNIRQIRLQNSQVTRTGGPGIQMSGVRGVHVTGNEVTYSGSTDDTRKWGRGSGLWTWAASVVLIEHNRFLYANGPGDSAGAHIDYNCDNVVLQYNFSAHNAGGFCEILGNNYNCAYRYNISVDDGHRVKGENGAFQEGKIFWLSGYQGEKKPRKGPVNSYFYNNTIYVSAGIVAKVAIDNRSNGILIANNIFHIEGESKMVAGDQYKPDDNSKRDMENVFFKNNVFLKASNWPADALILPQTSVFGAVGFQQPGGLQPENYLPANAALVEKGLRIPYLPSDIFGLMGGLNLEKDILGNPIGHLPSIGAIQVSSSPNMISGGK